MDEGRKRVVLIAAGIAAESWRYTMAGSVPAAVAAISGAVRWGKK